MIPTNDMNQLAALWLKAKREEADATEARREIEDHIKKLARIKDELDSTETIEYGEYVIKIAGRIDRKVDSDKLQELAAEFGITDHLSSLFRWKPEINMAAWKATDKSITMKFAAAITAKPGRHSFTITRKEK